MSLTTIIRAGLAATRAAAPEMVVTVVYDGQTATGLKSGPSDSAAASDMGEQGVAVGTVRVSAADIARPERGKTMLVNGEAVFIMRVLSTADALWTLDYQTQRPVEGL